MGMIEQLNKICVGRHDDTFILITIRAGPASNCIITFQVLVLLIYKLLVHLH
jgi:hypothetical protein